MIQNSQTSSELHGQMSAVVLELIQAFPELDLRFNLEEGSNNLRYQVAGISDNIYELALGVDSTRDVIVAAIFNIKQIASLYDS